MQSSTTTELAKKTLFPILFTISFTHLLNDLIQAVLPAVYPLIKTNFDLSFSQIGIITLTVQTTASLLQPFVGIYADRSPKPYFLALSMVFVLSGIVFVAFAPSYATILVAVCFLGIGSSIFHPEASRVAYLAAGDRRGLAQSIFQLGGNTGSAIGPLLAALIVIPYGQANIIWFCVIALGGIMVLLRIAKWYSAHLSLKATKVNVSQPQAAISRKRVVFSLIVLLVLIF